MRITQEADYALRVVLYLSRLGYNARVTAKIIAEKESIPLRFLLKLLRKLKKAGIVKSYMGANGGYALNKEPEEITLKNVIEAIDGPIHLNRCLYDPEKCNLYRTSKCPVHHALYKVQSNLIKQLESINFKNITNFKGI